MPVPQVLIGDVEVGRLPWGGFCVWSGSGQGEEVEPGARSPRQDRADAEGDGRFMCAKECGRNVCHQR